MQTVWETIEWRIIAIAITFIITYFWTGKLIEATELTVALNLAKTIGFYFWRKVKKGHLKIKITNNKSQILNRFQNPDSNNQNL